MTFDLNFLKNKNLGYSEATAMEVNKDHFKC